jgi:hypothetical protein
MHLAANLESRKDRTFQEEMEESDSKEGNSRASTGQSIY